MKIESIISELKVNLKDLSTKFDKEIDDLYAKIEKFAESCSKFDNNWEGQWATPNYNVYRDFTGGGNLIHIDLVNIQNFIEKESGVKLSTIKDRIPNITKVYQDFKEKIITDLAIIKGKENLTTEAELLDKIESQDWGIAPWDYVKTLRPQTIMTYDPFILNRGLDIPPHLSIRGEIMSLFSTLQSIENLEKNSKRILRQIELKYSIQDNSPDKSDFIIKVINSFHNVARQILNRHDNRDTIVINDEYDVQDLLHSLLRVEFDDIRPEENTPSYAGSSARIDFLLKNEKTLIEVKKTRKGLADREVGDQLILDSQHYKTHPDCKRLICFVYDPENRIKNPRGLENDLNKLSSDDLVVEVFIRP